MTILLFQEDETQTNVVLKSLTELGITVETFTDPKTFLLRVNAIKPALCLIDLESKYQPALIAVIKSIRKVLGAHPPIITIVKETDQATSSTAMAAGANAFLGK